MPIVGTDYTLPSNSVSPAVTGTTIDPIDFNAVLDDIETAIDTLAGAGGGTGDVTGPASSVDSELALFSGTGGKTLKRATNTGLLKATSGVLASATAGTDYADNAFTTIAVSGQSDVVADSASDTLTLAAGSGITLTTNAGTDTVTIAASGGGGGGNASYINNLTLAASVSGNALTIAVKVADGTTNPSSGDPISVTFRSATAATGTYDTVSIQAALSLTISSGSTLGFANATAGRGWIVLFNDAGTARLGIVNCLSGFNILPLQESSLLSSTAEGGAGAADSAQVIYTGTAVTTKAFRILGFFEYSSGLTTAGTYNIVPTKLQLFGPGVSKPGTVVQSDYVAKTDTFSTASTAAVDITGLTVAVTPTSACNLFNFRTTVMTGFDPAAGNGSYHWATRDSTVIAQGDAASSRTRVTSLVIPLYTSTMGAVTLEVMDAPRTTSSVTYKSQIAATASTVYVNRSQGDTDAAGRGRGMSSLTITEIQA